MILTARANRSAVRQVNPNAGVKIYNCSKHLQKEKIKGINFLRCFLNQKGIDDE